jgi:succinyl-CoA synthetase beta subunit
MQLLEHQGKALLAEAGIAVPAGQTADTPDAAAAAAADLGTPVMVKAQVPAGGRGKAGAVRPAGTPAEAAAAASKLLGSHVAGYPVADVLVEQRVSIATELYAAVTGDPESKGPLLLFCTEGGIDIEDAGEKVLRLPVDIRSGPDEAMVRSLIARSELAPGHLGAVAAVLGKLYRLYRRVDADLAELNPLAVTSGGSVIALDCKLSLDPAALRRHPDLTERFGPELPETGTELEREARRQGFGFIELDGDVGVLANGAGLTMATLDAVHHHGGRPANFLEIGGDAYTKAVPALRLVLANPRVRSLLVNFCGAFARTDVMAEGVVRAIEELRPDVPVSFSIHGTGEAEAVRLVTGRLGIQPHDQMDDAVREAVASAQRMAARKEA